jgi:hypothetical protein
MKSCCCRSLAARRWDLPASESTLLDPQQTRSLTSHPEQSRRGGDALGEQEQSGSGGDALGEWDQIWRGARSSTWAPGRGARG